MILNMDGLAHFYLTYELYFKKQTRFSDNHKNTFEKIYILLSDLF